MNSYIGTILLSGFLCVSFSVSAQTPRSVSPKGSPPPTTIVPMQTGVMLIRSDKEVSVSIDGKSAGHIAAGGFLSLSALAGEHFVEATEIDNACKWEKKVTVPPGMQVAEAINFGDMCGKNPDRILASPNPSNTGPAGEVDREREARKMHERGCLLVALGRAGEAVPILKGAAKVIPYPESSCLSAARSTLKFAQDSLKSCESRQIRSAANERPETIASPPARPDCNGEKIVLEYVIGDYTKGFELEDFHIHAKGEQISNDDAASSYQRRALYRFALGDPAALSDLDFVLGIYRIESRLKDGATYFYRAVIEQDAGNERAAMHDCQVAVSFQSVVDYQREFCNRIIATYSASEATKFENNPAVAGMSQPIPMHPSISQEIQTVSAGVYSPLPPIQSFGGPTISGTGTFQIKNDTPYTLTVMFSGPTERRVDITASGSTSADLPSGHYKILGRVNAPNVSPAYGEYDFNARSAGLEFYIR